MNATTQMVPLNSLKMFKGKTIKSIDERSENQIEIVFTDGKELRLEAVNIGPHGLIGIEKSIPQ